MRRTPLLIVCVLGISNARGLAQTITCPLGDIRSVEILPSIEAAITRSPRSPKVEVSAAQASPILPGNALAILAIGPILGSMDSSDVKTMLACTPKGLAVTATVTRSAAFNGAALQNVNWRPRMTVTVLPRHPHIVFRTTWRMRLSTGIEVKRAQTPPYPPQDFPQTVVKSLGSAP